MQVALAERPIIKARDRQDLSTVARQLLERHPHFRGRVCGVSIKHEGRNLYLSGRLPSFYLKQLVQEAVRHVPGVDFVYNEIDVVSADGISSVRLSTQFETWWRVAGVVPARNLAGSRASRSPIAGFARILPSTGEN